ncbi:unnamed protein product [Scytosiphon promiscuus]
MSSLYPRAAHGNAVGATIMSLASLLIDDCIGIELFARSVLKVFVRIDFWRHVAGDRTRRKEHTAKRREPAYKNVILYTWTYKLSSWSPRTNSDRDFTTTSALTQPSFLQTTICSRTDRIEAHERKPLCD